MFADPVGAGFIQSLARPGGNVTGFTNFEYSMSGKWVELLKQIAPTYLVWRRFGVPTWRRALANSVQSRLWRSRSGAGQRLDQEG